jgi:hypothetical protein
MKSNGKFAKFARSREELDGMGEMNEAELNQIGEALREFRLSVHAWSAHASTAQVLSDHAQNTSSRQVLGWNGRTSGQPRRVAAHSPRMRHSALGWAMGCVLVAAGLSAGLWEHYWQPASLTAARVDKPHWLAPARPGNRIPGAEEWAQQKPAQEKLAQEAKEDLPAKKEDLLAKVDSDVARQVPSAMEPLAELMAGDENQ